MEKIPDMQEKQLNNEVTICRRCHRRLKDEESKRLGYGKVCYSKIERREKNYLFEVGYE